MSQRSARIPDTFRADTDPKYAYNRVWFNMMRVQRSMGPRIARALREVGLEDPVWYDILMLLEQAGSDGLAMAEVEERLYLTQYALSRQAARMEKAGLIVRVPRPGRGRGQILQLTDAGIGLHSRIWDQYEAAMQAEIAPRMSTDEAYALNLLLIRLYP